MTIEEQLATLTTRLKDLETKVGQLGEQTPPGATAATPGPSSTTSAIKVSVPREKRFGKYSGVRDDWVLEDWISDTHAGASQGYWQQCCLDSPTLSNER